MVGYLGEGTGGYVSYAASTISDYNDIILDDMGAPIAKFWTGTPGQPDYIPMVIEAVNGDPEATHGRLCSCRCFWSRSSPALYCQSRWIQQRRFFPNQFGRCPRRFELAGSRRSCND